MRNQAHQWGIQAMIVLLAGWSSTTVAVKPLELPPDPSPHDRVVSSHDFRQLAAETSDANVQRASPPRSAPGRRQSQPRPAPGPAAPVPGKLPGTVLTPALVVTGEIGGIAALTTIVNAGALTATGTASAPTSLPSSISTPGLAVTGDGPE
jgi:hypothetical protein